MSEEDKHFINRYEELLDEGYCDCNEMNCIDNNSPRRILNIVKVLQNQLQQKENIIKEVREYIGTKYLLEFDDFEKPFILTDKNDWNKVLEMLDKENK